MSSPSDLHSIPFRSADGGTATLGDYDADVLLVVNVASKCGLTPQYEQLEQLQRAYRERGFSVVGFPCNQFQGQEPGSIDEILDYCATTWGVSFPVNDKLEVNGADAAPLYRALTGVPDAEGAAGDVAWNFEKFLVTADGSVRRFRPQVKPDDAVIVGAIEAALAE